MRLLVLYLLGFIIRLGFVLLGNNFDFESWIIVGEYSSNMSNFYCYTDRYNYGPIWGELLGYIYNITSDRTIFRLIIVSFLSVADIGITEIIRRNFARHTWLLYLFSPISIFITGFHNQIDCVAIFLTLLGFHFYWNKRGVFNQLSIPVLLGISLTFKHSFIFLPIWVFFYYYHKKEIKKSLLNLIPLIIFGLSFVPYLNCWESIFQNVFKYYSRNNAPLFNMVTFNYFIDYSYSTKIFKGLFILFIVVSGFFISKVKSLKVLLLLYPLVMLLFSQSISNQYLVIPLYSLAVIGSWPYWIYTAVGSFYLLLENTGLGLGQILFDSFSNEDLRYYYFKFVAGFIAVVIIQQMFGNNKLKKIEQ